MLELFAFVFIIFNLLQIYEWNRFLRILKIIEDVYNVCKIFILICKKKIINSSVILWNLKTESATKIHGHSD